MTNLFFSKNYYISDADSQNIILIYECLVKLSKLLFFYRISYKS